MSNNTENALPQETAEEKLTSSQKHRETRRKRRSVLKLQKGLIVGGIIFICLLIPTLIFVNYLVNIYTYTDYDGEKYKIKAVAGVYAMYGKDGAILPMDPNDEYYQTELGTLVEVDPDTGDYSVYAVVDTEDGEFLGTSSRLLMFKHISQDETQQVEVHNNYGTFTFYRDADDSFQIKGYENYPYSATMFSSLVVSAGYPLTVQKIDDPIKGDDGNYHEYGLAKETRTDADGNEYEYSPIWYRITDIDGNSFTVYIGDEIPSGAGYYVKYTNRDAVYIMSYSVSGDILSMYDTVKTASDIANILDEPLEAFVTPTVCYPMTLTTYFDVQNFALFNGDEIRKAAADENYEANPVVMFSFWDMDERFGTFFHTRSYYLQYPENYLVNTNNTDAALQSFYSMYFVGVKALGYTEENLAAYGLDDPEYYIYFEFGDDGNGNKIEHNILISKKTDNNTYYITSALYEMIIEVESSQLLFLDYDLTDWVDPAYFDMNLAWATEITVETADITYTFTLDNSLSDSMSNPTYSDEAKENTTISSANMTMTGKDSNGNTIQAISNYSITDKQGYTWTITADKVTVTDSDGNSVSKVSGLYKSTNALGTEVTVVAATDSSGKVVTGCIEGADGTQVFVDPNYITIKSASGKSERYLRYGMSIFRKFYQSLLYASLEGNAHDGTYGLTQEEIDAYTSAPDKDCQTKITVKTGYSGMPEYVFRYYAYSERRSLITVNGGTGEFYVLRSFTDKIVADAGRVIAGESVDPTSKY